VKIDPFISPTQKALSRGQCGVNCWSDLNCSLDCNMAQPQSKSTPLRVNTWGG
jgi:hypothetical protein